MSLILITGSSGSGKTTICRALSKQGYKSYDADENKINGWVNKKTGEFVTREPFKSQKDKETWRNKYFWLMSENKVKEIAASVSTKPVFICGSGAVEGQVLKYFEKVIYLTLDKNTLTKRLKSRTENHFGKAKHELKDILHWHSTAEEYYQKYGAVIVDASKTVDNVVDQIIQQVKLPNK